MTTESEAKLARYSEIVKEADEFGRVIGVRRLKPSEQTKIAGMTSELTGYDEMVNPAGDTVHIPHRMPLMLAASVCMIDDAHIPFPRSRGELDAIFDRLDIEGMGAIGKAYARLQGIDLIDKDNPPLNQIDEAKNL